MNARSLAILLAPALACPLGAQAFAPLVGGHLPFSGGGATPPELEDLLVGDLDGDGAPDLVALGSYTNFVCRNDRAGGLVQVQSLGSPFGLRLRRGVLADVDRDGDLDLLAGDGSDQPSRTNTGPIRQFENQGGNLVEVTTARMPAGNWLNGAMVVLDHDRDGDLDLVVAQEHAAPVLRVFDNDGLGTFTLAAARLPAITTRSFSMLAATDLDRDGDLDLLASSQFGSPSSVLFLRNDGTGHFTDATASLPGVGNQLVHAVVDIDGDGDDDLLAATSFLLNDGTASAFTPRATGITLYQFSVVRFADLDGDGRLDLVGTRLNANDVLPRIYMGQANGTFLERPAFLPAELRAAEVIGIGNTYWIGASPLQVFDLDQDGRPDLVHGGWKGHLSPSSWTVGLPPRALLNRDGIEFRDGSRCALPHVETDAYSVAAGDLDQDGDPDLIVGQDLDRVYRNRGDGTFELHDALPFGSTAAGVLADLDGDLDLDFVRTSSKWSVPRAGGLSVVLQQGGAWTSVPLLAGGNIYVEAIAVGDVDGDRDLDLVLGCFNVSPAGALTRLLLNDGRAGFVEVTGRLPAELRETMQVLLRDLDGDGDLDLIERSNAWPVPPLRLSLNDGTGTFTDVSSSRLPALSSSALAAVDLDRDGDVDLVTDGITLVNDGTCHFTVQANAFPIFEHVVELDGAWTAVTGGLHGVQIGPVWHPWVEQSYHATAPVDVDRDGDLDVVVVTAIRSFPYHFGRHHGVLFNLRQQLQAPRLLRVGRSWILSLQATAPGALGIPILGTTELQPRVPLGPFGLLGVDPGAAVLLPAMAVGASPAASELRLPVPPDPSLVGVRLHAQALIVPPSGLQDARLTSVVSDRATR